MRELGFDPQSMLGESEFAEMEGESRRGRGAPRRGYGVYAKRQQALRRQQFLKRQQALRRKQIARQLAKQFWKRHRRPPGFPGFATGGAAVATTVGSGTRPDQTQPPSQNGTTPSGD